jgi:hypothetical protein
MEKEQVRLVEAAGVELFRLIDWSQVIDSRKPWKR